MLGCKQDQDVAIDFYVGLCKIHNITSRELIRVIEKDGWRLARINGSHHHFLHPIKPGLVAVPHPRKDIPLGTARSILKQAGLK